MVTRLYTLPFCLPPLCSLFSLLSPPLFRRPQNRTFLFFLAFLFGITRRVFPKQPRFALASGPHRDSRPPPPLLSSRVLPGFLFLASRFLLLVFCFLFCSVLFCWQFSLYFLVCALPAFHNRYFQQRGSTLTGVPDRHIE